MTAEFRSRWLDFERPNFVTDCHQGAAASSGPILETRVTKGDENPEASSPVNAPRISSPIAARFSGTGARTRTVESEATKGDEIAAGEVNDFLRRHGIDPDRLVSTGPAPGEEILAARFALGDLTPAEWTTAVARRRAAHPDPRDPALLRLVDAGTPLPRPAVTR